MALRACSKPRPAVLIEYQPGPGHLLAVARLDGRPDGGGAQNSTLPLQRRPEVVFCLFSPWVEDRE